jgi:hypothetical protein
MTFPKSGNGCPIIVLKQKAKYPLVGPADGEVHDNVYYYGSEVVDEGVRHRVP